MCLFICTNIMPERIVQTSAWLTKVSDPLILFLCALHTACQMQVQLRLQMYEMNHWMHNPIADGRLFGKVVVQGMSAGIVLLVLLWHTNADFH